VIVVVGIGTIVAFSDRIDQDNQNSNKNETLGTSNTNSPTEVPSTILNNIETFEPMLFTSSPSVAASSATAAPSPSSTTVDPTATSTLTTTDSSCIHTIKPFSNNGNVTTMISLHLQVSPTISLLEIQYVASVFQKTYNILATSCDYSYCRHISNQHVVNHTFLQEEIVNNVANQKSSDCNATVEVILSLEGTYRGCQEVEKDNTDGTSNHNDFPGLFRSSSSSSFHNGRRQQRRHMLRWTSSSSSSRMMRQLQAQQDEENVYDERQCPSAAATSSSCPITAADDATGTTTSSSVADNAIDRMNQSVAMLPKVCEIKSAHDVVPM
jgi:hypothetical protein